MLYGIPDSSPSETFAQSEKLFVDNIREHIGISLDPKEIDRAHRLGRYPPGRNRPIIVKFAFYKTCCSSLERHSAPRFGLSMTR